MAGLFWVAAAVDLVFFFLAFPPKVLFSKEPIGYIDFMQHTAHTAMFCKLAGQGYAWGYDPTLMAGYPTLTVFDMDNKLVELVGALGKKFSIPVDVSVKWVMALEYLVGPLLAYPAFCLFGFSPELAGLGTLAAVLLIQTPCGLFFAMGGMISFLFCTFFSFLGVSIWQAFLGGQEMLLGLMILMTALVPLIHSMGIILTGVPALYLLLSGIGVLDAPKLLGVATAALAAFLVNGYWLIPAWKNRHWLAAGDRAWTGEFHLKREVLFWVGGICTAPGGLFGLLLLLQRQRMDERHQPLLMLCFLMVCFILVAAGPAWILCRSVQPKRFLFPLFLYLVLACLCRLESNGVKTLDSVEMVFCTVSVLLPMALLICLRLMPRNTIPTQLSVLRKMAERHLDGGNLKDARTKELVEWLRKNTSPVCGRVLIEHPQGTGAESPYLCFYLGLLPAIAEYVKGEFLGAPRCEAPLKQCRDTRFTHEEILGRRLAALDKDLLRQRLDLYHVKWIVAVKGQMTDFLEQFPMLLERKTEIGGTCYIYEILDGQTSGSYFLQGHGTVQADLNRLELSGLQEKQVVLKYHWLSGFTASEGAEVEQFTTPEDETGFLKISNIPSGKPVTLNFQG